MYLAAKVTATPAETWAIVVVAVICLAFWLIMVVGIAPRPDARQRHRRQPMDAPVAGGVEVPVAGGVHVAAGGRSVAPSRDAPATEMPHVPQERDTEALATGSLASEGLGADPEGTEETCDDLPPAVPGPREAARPAGASPMDLGGPAMPAQREPATDEAASTRRPDR